MEAAAAVFTGSTSMSDNMNTPAAVTSDCLDSEGLGRLLGLGNPARPGSAARAIQARIERKHPMPPAVNLPGHRGRIWLRATVLRWLAAYEAPLARGRPRTIDLIAMGRPRPERLKKVI